MAPLVVFELGGRLEGSGAAGADVGADLAVAGAMVPQEAVLHEGLGAEVADPGPRDPVDSPLVVGQGVLVPAKKKKI